MEDMGKNTPQRKIIGNRKKLERVIASKTSFTPTETNIPRSEKARPDRTMMKTKLKKCWTGISMMRIKKMVIKNVMIKPKTALPSVLPRRIVVIFNGANKSRSKAPILFSKAITMAAMDVDEKRRVIPINPGTISFIPIGFLR